jgi:peptide deformylase
MVDENGIGLAANQVGRSLRVFILKDDEYFTPEKYRRYKEFINPEMVSQSELVDFEGEGCLSIPGVSATTKRFRRVMLRWTDRQGKIQEEEFLDIRAFAIQHEMDHLNGKLYIDQFGPIRRGMVVKKHKKFLKLRSK